MDKMSRFTELSTRMTSNNAFAIALCCDEKYLCHAVVTALSVIHHTAEPARLHFTFFGEHYSADAKEKVEKSLAPYHCQVSFVDLEGYDFSLAKNSGWHYSTLYRLNALGLYPNNPEKVLYLDCDMLIFDDIAPLWDIDLSDKYAAVVQDIHICRGKDKAFRKQIGLADDHIYFNAGLLLINTKLWIEADITQQSFHFIEKNREIIQYLDQDALNYLFQHHVHYLPLRWNVTSGMYRKYLHFGYPKILDYFAPEVNEAANYPANIHYTGTPKPWDNFCPFPKAEFYRKYAKETEFPPYPSKKTKFKEVRKYWKLKFKQKFLLSSK